MKITLAPLPPELSGRPVLAREPLLAQLPLARRLEDIGPRPDPMLPEDREELSQALLAQTSPLEPHVAVLDSIRALAQPGVEVVLTGALPGIWGGPLGHLHRALHAVRLARSLAQLREQPVVPVFWNRADDHDLAAAGRIWLFNENRDLQRLSLRDETAARRPLSRVVFAPRHRLSAARAFLSGVLARAPHGEAVLEACTPREGESLARSFTRFLTETCGHLGLVVVEPDTRRLALSRALAAVIGRDPVPRLLTACASLPAGLLEHGPDPARVPLVYHLREGLRRPLRLGGEGFKFDDEPGSRRADELAAQIITAPAEWSAGGILSPLLEEHCLPVAATVGGWGEIGMRLLSNALHTTGEKALPPFVPRFACTHVLPEIRQALQRLEWTPEEALRAGQDEETGQKMAAGEEPGADIARELRDVAARAAEQARALAPRLERLDPRLIAQLKRTARQTRDHWEKLAGKIERVGANRSGTGRRTRDLVRSSLRPRGREQDRTLAALPFLARYGRPWVDALLDGLVAFPAQAWLAYPEGESTEGGSG